MEAGYRGRVPDHLRRVSDDDPESWEPSSWARDLGYAAEASDDEHEPITRPTWWRWVAIAVVIAMVVGTPIVYLWAIVTR